MEMQELYSLNINGSSEERVQSSLKSHLCYVGWYVVKKSSWSFAGATRPNTKSPAKSLDQESLNPFLCLIYVFLSQATQRDNNKFTTTTVTISVQVKSLHPPKFQKSQYEGIISAVGKMAMDPNNKDQPLIILATDDDYAGTEVKH